MPTHLHSVSGEHAARRHIIFMHGLMGHWETTWLNQTGEAWWTWLAADLPDCRIWSLEYEAPFSRWRRDCMMLSMRGQNVARVLLANEALKSGRISFVLHSLGGLVFKQVLRCLDGLRNTNDLVPSFLERIDKAVFLGTPHGGAALASRSNSLKWLLKPSNATASLRLDDPILLDLNTWYRNYTPKRIDHLILKETAPERFLWFKQDVVSGLSADPGILGADPIPVDSSHTNLTKPASKDDQIYVLIKAFLAKQQIEYISDFQVNKIGANFNKLFRKYLEEGRDNINSTMELQVAAIASLDKDISSQEIGEPAVNEGNSGLRRIRQLQNVDGGLDIQLKDDRLASIAIQALAIAQSGVRNENDAMARRGVEQARASLDALSASGEDRSFLFERLSACEEWLKRYE